MLADGVCINTLCADVSGCTSFSVASWRPTRALAHVACEVALLAAACTRSSMRFAWVCRPPSPEVQSYTYVSRGFGAGSAACQQDGKEGAAAQKGFAFPLHCLPLSLTAGVNFTLSCRLLDKIISSWFPLHLILREPEH